MKREGFPPDRQSQWSPLIARFTSDYVIFSHIMPSEAVPPRDKIPEERMSIREFDVPHDIPEVMSALFGQDFSKPLNSTQYSVLVVFILCNIAYVPKYKLIVR